VNDAVAHAAGDKPFTLTSRAWRMTASRLAAFLSSSLSVTRVSY